MKSLPIKALSALFFSTCLYPQAAAISGKVADPEGQPVPLATVTVLGFNDKILVTGSTTSPDGTFSIQEPKAGVYFLRVTAQGFETLETPAFELTAPPVPKDLGTIFLSKAATQLEEVTIQSFRPVITQEADKMVVRIEGTAFAAGNTALGVLTKVPGVFVDPEGNIRLNGRAGVNVMIDGKPTYMSAEDLRSLLEGMPAGNVRSIEVIGNPSSRFDAEGTSGILNINLRKNLRDGMNGNLFAGYSNNFKQYGFSYGGTFNYRAGRWSTYFSAGGARRTGGREATFTRIFHAPAETTYFDQRAVANGVNTGPPMVRAAADYALSDKSTIGGMVRFIRNDAENEFLTDTYVGNAPQSPGLYIDADNISANRYANFTTNLHYVAKLDTLGSGISADFDYVRVTNRGTANFYNYFTDVQSGETTQDFLRTATPNAYDVYSAKADYNKSFGAGHSLEAGLKASHVVSDNDFRFYFNNGSLVPDPQRTNHFNYKEDISAAYLSWNHHISEKVSVKGGVRAEHTASTGISYTTGENNSRSYLDVFPSVFVQQNATADYTVNYSYGRRITRPNYGSLNPFRSYRDPYTWTQGNPHLRPQYTHSFSVTQTYKARYSLVLNYDYDKDVMSEIPILDEENAITIYTTGNVDDARSFNATAMAPFKLAKWWDSQNTGIVSYNKFSMRTESGRVVNEALSFVLQSNHTISLPWKLRLEANFTYLGPSASGLYHMGAMHRLDLGLKRTFMGKKVEAVLNANDIFKGYRFKWTTDINGNVNDFDQYFRFRSIALTLRYNFSKGQKVGAARNNTVEEVNRI
jgi:hypothetical protein